MDKRIVIIVTSQSIAQSTQQEMTRLGCAHPVILSNRDTLAEHARQAIVEGAKVFISRGRASNTLKQTFDLPVVDFRFTFYDIYSALQQAQQHSAKLAVVGSKDTWQTGIGKYQDELGHIRFVCIEDSARMDEIILALKKEGIESIVCGMAVMEVAKKHGIHTTLVGLERRSVADAIGEAQHLLHIELQRQKHIATVKAILDCASEGIIAVNQDGIVTDINNMAAKFFQKSCIGAPVDTLIDDPLIRQALTTEGALQNELIPINNTMCTVTSQPIRSQNGTVGVVFTARSIRATQTLEQSIRKKQYESGNIAKCSFSDIISKSNTMALVVNKAKEYAKSNATIMILGETGVGKEMFAQSIHNYSDRSKGPFVAINCAALPQSILESELFGYDKGAFTGASSGGKTGYFELAHTGTIFLDEIGELPLEMQSKLLRVLQERELRRIGSHKVFKLDVRVIVASNKNLFSLTSEGLFRQDLYYRLAVLELHIPPLRLRREDIIPIAQDILADSCSPRREKAKQLVPDVKSVLEQMDWPGNVRQLRNIMERLQVISKTSTITMRDLQLALNNFEQETTAPSAGRKGISQSKMHAVAVALREEQGNRERTAARLGISKTTLWRLLREIQEAHPDYLDTVYYEGK